MKKLLYIVIAFVGLALISRFTGNDANAENVPQPKEVVKQVDTLTYAEKFDKKQFSRWGGVYKPVREYLKKNLNDPSSLEIDKTWNLGMNKDSSFSIKTTFRAKNEYNALVLQAMYCNVDFDGHISNIKIE